jgi:acetyl esterase/lipase
MDPVTSHQKTAKPLPFLTRIQYAIGLWTYSTIVKVAILIFRFVKPLPHTLLPTYTKKYTVRPTITNRVFIPRTYKSGDKPLPLFIDIHGGGFAIGAPLVDGRDNAILAHQHGICVVSIGYRLAPKFRFPSLPEDCAVLAEAVINDPDLPIDRSKVAIGGYSAGGNLSLTASQVNGLHNKIKGVVAYYPIVDFTRSNAEKLKNRASNGKEDMLKTLAPWFKWAYLPPGTDTRNPLLSPILAPREKLPKNICIIGCEYDMLFKEAEDMAKLLAEKENGEMKMMKDGNAYEKGNVRWEKIAGMEHGFNQIPAIGESGMRRLKRGEEMHADVAEWLFRKVYV